MPAVILPYVLGLLLVAGRATCTRMAQRLLQPVSHDALTRTLTRVQSDGQTLLVQLARRLFGEFTDGYLIIDDTVIPKAFARCIECLGWMYSSKAKRQVQGLCVVVLMWSNGRVALPIAFRLWKPKSKKRTTLALELLKHAKQKMHIQPSYVLFDTFYASKKVLKWIDKNGWYFVSQVKRNRKLNDVQVRRVHRYPYWVERGHIDGRLKVTIARHGKKFFITNDAALTSQAMRAVYKHRWKIEEAFRLLHDQLNLDTCQAQSAVAQTNHITYCCVAYLALVSAAQRKHISAYQFKEQLSFEREPHDIQFIERLLSTA